MKFLKKYWTHLISLAVFFPIILMLFFNMKEFNLIGLVLVLLELIGVIGGWFVIIYYMIYTARDNSIDKKGLKMALIYLLNLYYIPCFKLKYVDKDDSYRFKNVIFIIVIVLLTFGYIFGVIKLGY